MPGTGRPRVVPEAVEVPRFGVRGSPGGGALRGRRHRVHRRGRDRGAPSPRPSPPDCGAHWWGRCRPGRARCPRHAPTRGRPAAPRSRTRPGHHAPPGRARVGGRVGQGRLPGPERAGRRASTGRPATLVGCPPRVASPRGGHRRDGRRTAGGDGHQRELLAHARARDRPRLRRHIAGSDRGGRSNWSSGAGPTGDGRPDPVRRAGPVGGHRRDPGSPPGALEYRSPSAPPKEHLGYLHPPHRRRDREHARLPRAVAPRRTLRRRARGRPTAARPRTGRRGGRARRPGPHGGARRPEPGPQRPAGLLRRRRRLRPRDPPGDPRPLPAARSSSPPTRPISPRWPRASCRPSSSSRPWWPASPGLPVANASLYDGGSAAVEARQPGRGGHRAARRVWVLRRGPPALARSSWRRSPWAPGHGIAPSPRRRRDHVARRAAVDEGVPGVVVGLPQLPGLPRGPWAARAAGDRPGARWSSAPTRWPPASSRRPAPRCRRHRRGGPGLRHAPRLRRPLPRALRLQASDVRRLPGRLVGETSDVEGRTAYVTTLRAREQDIRREKASSNVCTNQTLMAVTAAIQLGWLGRPGCWRWRLRWRGPPGTPATPSSASRA